MYAPLSLCFGDGLSVEMTVLLSDSNEVCDNSDMNYFALKTLLFEIIALFLTVTQLFLLLSGDKLSNSQ
jgi:hypothetical protein